MPMLQLSVIALIFYSMHDGKGKAAARRAPSCRDIRHNVYNQVEESNPEKTGEWLSFDPLIE